VGSVDDLYVHRGFGATAQVESVEDMKAALASNEGKHVEAEGHRKKLESQLDEQVIRRAPAV
jgi:hypothetical protein